MFKGPKSNKSNLDEQTLDFIDDCVAELKTRDDKINSKWQLSNADNYEVDLDKGVIGFYFSNQTIVADIQVIGTFFDSTFLWGWDHPSVPEKLRHDASLVRKWGIEKDINIFTQRKTPCDENMAWSFVAIASKLAGADGAFRAKNDNTLVFVTITNLRKTNN